MAPQNIEDRLKYSVTETPNIIHGENNSYVIVGSIDHGHQIPQEGITELINSLVDVIALKMEGPEDALNLFHALSTEIITKIAVGQVPISYLPESNGEDIGKKLLRYEVPKEIAEVYVPFLHIMMNDDIPKGFFDNLPLMFEKYKERFNFIDTNRGITNFYRVANYWKDNELNSIDLDHFAYDFTAFMGDVREFEFWKQDLKNFRSEYNERIAVCVSTYHVPFVKTILDGKEPVKPDWFNHLNMLREDKYNPRDSVKLKQIYAHLENALNLKLNLK